MFPWVKNIKLINTLSEKIKSISIVKSDFTNIQEFLDSDSYNAPNGDFEIKKPLIWSKSKNVDWGNCRLILNDNINALLIRAKKFGSTNLYVDGTGIKNPNPEFSFVTLQWRNELQQYYTLRDTTLIGNEMGVFSVENGGNIGINYDPKTEFNGSYASDFRTENHWGIIDNLMINGLHTGLNMQHTLDGINRGLSRFDITVQGSRCKKAVRLATGRVNLFVKYNNAYTLVESEQDYGVVEVEGSWNNVKVEFPDAGKPPKTLWNGKTQYTHKYAIVDHKNYGNTLKTDLGEILVHPYKG